MTSARDELFVVTGGTQGIGLAIAQAAAASGRSESVIVVSRHPGVEGDGSWEHVAADLSTRPGIDAAIAGIRSYQRPVRVLVNNAGAILENNAFSALTWETMLASIVLHSIAPVLLTRGLEKELRAAQDASVINIGSIYGGIPDPEVFAYVCGKASLPIVTEMMARALAPDVRVNCVQPGHIETAMTRAATAEFRQHVIAHTDVQRLGEPSEVAAVVMFLASAASGFINGTSIRLDGGYWGGVS